MGKKFVTKIGLMALTVMLAIMFSCSKDTGKKENSTLQQGIFNIENSIFAGKFNKEVTSREIINSVFFDKLSEMRQVENEEIWNQRIDELSGYQLSTKKFQKTTKVKSELIITSEENIIYSSLARSLKNSSENPIAVLNHFTNEIACLEMNENIKKNCLETLVFYTDALIYFNFDKSDDINKVDENKGSNETPDKRWNCLYRDCMDCCMNSKLHDLEEANIVEQIWALVKFPETLAELLTSCGWDCIFHN